jgi:hypothetical protein
MATHAKPKETSRARTRAYRERLRAKGLRPVTIWVLDVTNPEIREQLARDCKAISRSPEEREVMEWLDTVRHWPEDEPDMPDYGSNKPPER